MIDLREQLQATLGKAYVLEQELGGGGMSRVFVADDVALDRKVVVKVLPPELAAAVSLERFKREILLAAKLQHPHIVPLLSAGETDGLPYFMMPFVRGESLRARLSRGGELPVSEAVRTIREIASALAYAHDNRIVHRDIKPENILMSGGSAVVTDFGVAKALSASSEPSTTGSLTSMGIALGTPAYMSPEQATADPHTDHRADIYALGTIAYEMLTGSTPFGGRPPQSTLAAHVTETPENITLKRASVPPILASIIMRCLEKHAADRPQTAHELMDQLDSMTTPSGGMIPTSAQRAVKGRATKWIAVAVGVALAITAAGTVYAVRLNTEGGDAAEAKRAKSIAVLPFTNMSGDPSNEYFSDGLAEELLNVLAQIPGLQVAARTSSFQFKGKTTDIREIGSRLGVSTVLEGSVRKSGSRMRITAQLIDAKSGYHLWSQTFDRNVTDVFAVQDEITSAIGNALRVRLIASTAVRAKESRPDNTAAHDLYLKGLFARNLRTQTGIRDAIGYFRSATATDSTYALAHAALARTLLMQAAYGYIALAKVLPDARAASIRAVRLAPSLVETRSSHAMMLDVEGRSQEAEAEIKQVVAQYPNYADARVVYSNFLSRQGRARESLEQLRAAQKLDPISVSNSIAMGIQFMFVRDYKAAVAELQRAFTLDPNNPTAEIMLASALSADGLHVEAVRIAEKTRAQASDDPWVALTLAYVYARAGETEKASAIMKAEEKDPAATEYAAEMAAAYGALGRKDAAFAWLNKIESIAGIYPRLDPMFDSLRGDPRFNAFLAKWS